MRNAIAVVSVLVAGLSLASLHAQSAAPVPPAPPADAAVPVNVCTPPSSPAPGDYIPSEVECLRMRLIYDEIIQARRDRDESQQAQAEAQERMQERLAELDRMARIVDAAHNWPPDVHYDVLNVKFRKMPAEPAKAEPPKPAAAPAKPPAPGATKPAPPKK